MNGKPKPTCPNKSQKGFSVRDSSLFDAAARYRALEFEGIAESFSLPPFFLEDVLYIHMQPPFRQPEKISLSPTVCLSVPLDSRRERLPFPLLALLQNTVACPFYLRPPRFIVDLLFGVRSAVARSVPLHSPWYIFSNVSFLLLFLYKEKSSSLQSDKRSL